MSEGMILERANIPVSLWAISRETGVVIPENEIAWKETLGYLDAWRESYASNLASGLSCPAYGLTFMGPRNSGKTYFGCAILKYLLAHTFLRDQRLIGEHMNLCRLDYQALMSEAEVHRFDIFRPLHRLVEEADWLFLDNIHSWAPSISVSTALNFRRDGRKPTFLAFLASEFLDLGYLKSIFEMWQDQNKFVNLPISILPHLTHPSEFYA